MAASLTMWLKVSRSSCHSTQSVFAVMVAARGTLYSRASSPNSSPEMYSFRNLGDSSFGYTGMHYWGNTKSLVQERVPASTR